MTEREQIKHILRLAGCDHVTRQEDGRTELEWMVRSCPSVEHAIAESLRRAGRPDWSGVAAPRKQTLQLDQRDQFALRVVRSEP